MRLPNLCVIGAAALASVLPHREAMAQVHTLQEAFGAAYSNNPTLQSSRAQLRATDEGVPQALAGWRPTIVTSSTVGYGFGELNQDVPQGNGRTLTQSSRLNRPIYTVTPTLTQPLYRGGATRAGTNQADNRVFAQRGRLIATEQSVFNDTVSAYVGVIQSQQLNQLNINNEQVLARQLQATNDRFRVGEITRTDVAQAEAALAGARATRQTSEGNLQTARANYRRYVGEFPDQQLVEPQPLKLPIKNEDEAVQLASQNNPNVIAALFDDASAKDAVDLAFSQLMPQLSVQVAGSYTNGQQVVGQRTLGAQVALSASIPIYQGGAEYSRVRQAKQAEQQARKNVDDIRRQAIQNAAQSYETLVAARSTIDSTRAAIRANQIALEGVQREAIVGSRTTLDVLNAEQALLNSRVTLVQNLSNLVTASYALAAAIGRLTARDLNLNVPLYDETAYYNAVRQRLFGVNDYATNQPGR